MTRFTRYGLFVFLVATSLLIPGLTLGQDLAGLVGTVIDPTGAAVARAAVKLVNTRTGSTLETQTNETGYFRFLQLSPGPGYELTVTRDGFRSVTISNLYLAVATTRTQDVQLAIGAVTQTVEVRSEGSVSLDTTDSTIGNNFDLRAMANLPNQFRDNPGNLLRLQPTVVTANTNNTTDDPGGSRDGSVAGARADQDNITVDGIDASEFGIGQPFVIVSAIPVDAIQEFRTEVANPTAANGRGSGAQTIITTKSGTNEWHGSLREYHRNTDTEANSFFNKQSNPVVPRPTLIRNQFGGNVGGPALKNKLFFFFDYDGRRDASKTSVVAQVPLDHVRDQQELAYVNHGSGCTPFDTIQSNPSCISYASPALLKSLDPCNNPTAMETCTVNGPTGGGPVTPGFNPGMLALFQTRLPRANNIASGDGLNSGGFQFNAPNPFDENTYTARVDYNINTNQKLFVRFNFNNVNAIVPGLNSIQFPGDPLTNPQVNRDRSWAIGHTWTINSNSINQFVYGETRADFDGIATFNPNGPVFQLNWLLNTPWTAPYARQGGQSGINPIPTFRDDVTLIRGKHSWQFGGLWKPIRTRSRLVNDLDFINSGIGFTNTTLDSTLRPPDILNDPNGIADATWDAYYSAVLGVISQQVTLTNFLKNGTTLANLSGERRDYRYYEYEAYAMDSWKVRSDLTLTYGLRYQYDSVPYETNGLEATAPGVSLNSMFSTRVANGLAGVSGPLSSPLLTYVFAGKANNGPSLYNGDKTNFSPRLGLAWNPGFRDGLLGSTLGDHKTVVRLGFGLVYDHNALSAVNFAQDQSSFLFQDVQAASVTGATPELFLADSARFTNASSPAYLFPTPVFSPPPFTPFSSGSGSNLVVNGAQQGQFGNYAIDPNFKTPYSLTYSAGVQRQLPGDFQLEVDYYGRFGRRLLTLGNSAQFTDFIDPQSKEGEVTAITNLELAARAGTPVTSVPTQRFLENQILAANPGFTCPQLNGFFGLNGNTCTQLVYAANDTPLTQGNLLGVATFLTGTGLVNPGVGFPAQFLSNYYLTNRAWSSYNAMIATLRKRLSHNLQMDFNYTFSHSIDNSSQTARNNSNPLVNAVSALCDVRNLSVCRGNSEFDQTHQISSTFIYDLPVGRGQWIGRDSANWLNEIIGGWQVSGIATWHTGLAFPVTSGVGTTGFNTDAFAIFNGNQSALDVNVHRDPTTGFINLFANPAAAKAAFSPVTGEEIGSRDILRGPHFSNLDLAVAKYFPLWSEKYKLQFRAEAYNVFNHVNFGLPSQSSINNRAFGQITTTANDARVLQFALRVDF